MQLPNEDDINVHGSLDEIAACVHFSNKTVDEAELLFREHSEKYSEDLLWMGPRAFAYYFPAAINYLKSEFSAEDNFMLASICSTINFRKGEIGKTVPKEIVLDLIDYVLANYDKFDADDETYGYLRESYEKLKSIGECEPS